MWTIKEVMVLAVCKQSKGMIVFYEEGKLSKLC